MIYCFGLRSKYDAKLASGRPFFKFGRGIVDQGFSPGGAVFQTREDMLSFLAGKPGGEERSAYGVDADRELDTMQVDGEPYHRLTRNAVVVAPGDIVQVKTG